MQLMCGKKRARQTEDPGNEGGQERQKERMRCDTSEDMEKKCSEEVTAPQMLILTIKNDEQLFMSSKASSPEQ